MKNTIPSFQSAEEAVEQVLAADAARGAAILAADASELGKLLADDLRYNHSNGHLETKETHIGTFIDGLRYSKFETSGLHGHLIADGVVVLTGVIDQTKGRNGQMASHHLLFHAVWRRAGEAWQLASLQTAMPPAKK